VINTINQHFVRSLRVPTNIERLNSLGYIPLGNTPEEHTAQIKAMVAQWIDVMQKTGIRIE